MGSSHGTVLGTDLGLALAPDAPERLTLARFLEDVVGRFGPRVALRFDGVDTCYVDLGDL